MKLNVSSILLGTTLAGAALLTGCAATRNGENAVLLSDRGCIPAPLAAPAKSTVSQEELTSPKTPFVPAGTEAQPVLPSGTTVPAAVEENPIYVDAKENGTKKTEVKADDAKDEKKDAEKKAPRTYKVVKGDSLYIIAHRYKVSMTELAKQNNLTDKSILQIGQELVLPENALEKPLPRPQRKKTEKPAAAQDGGESQKPKGQPIPEDGIYITQKGDSLWKIAFNFRVNTDDIEALNPDINFQKLQPDMKIKLPKKSAPAQKPETAKPAQDEQPKPAEASATPVEPILPFQANEKAAEPPTPPTVQTDIVPAPAANEQPQAPALP